MPKCIYLYILLLFPFNFCQAQITIKSLTQGKAKVTEYDVEFISSYSNPKRLGYITEKRLAYLMGAASYQSPFKPLPRDNNDIDSMVNVLTELGFDVIVVKDGNLDAFKKGFDKLQGVLMDPASDYKVALFYFSGHGTQWQSKQFLIPRNFPEIPSSLSSPERTVFYNNHSVQLHKYIEPLILNKIPKIMVMVDACRVEDAKGDVGQDLLNESIQAAQVLSYPNVHVLNATQPGKTASAGINDKKNSLFTEAVLHFIRQENLSHADFAYEVTNYCYLLEGQAPTPGGNPHRGFSFNPKNPSPNLYPLLSKNQTSTTPQTNSTINEPILPTTNTRFNVKTFTRHDITIEYVEIVSGSFMEGSPLSESERENNEYNLQRSVDKFNLGVTEVTFNQYDAFCDATHRKKPNDEGWGRGNRPVINVSGDDVTAFCNFMECRLPTEEEWEYACRAGSSTPFNTGNNLTTQQANYNGGFPYKNNVKGVFIGKTLPVKSFEPNSWGLYDMHGNVEEWCANKFIKLVYEYRGGSWNDNARYCRSAYSDTSNLISKERGFRVVCPR